MSPATTPVRSACRRRLHYVDGSVQSSLMAATIGFEIVLAALAVWFLHWRLNDLIEQALYRVHFVRTGSLLQQLADDGLLVLAMFAAINLLVLLAIVMLWSRRENRVLREFSQLIKKTRELDFSGDAEIGRRHEVLVLAKAWRTQERERYSALHKQMADLALAVAARKPAAEIRGLVESVRKLLR